jgi:hypothetical protein
MKILFFLLLLAISSCFSAYATEINIIDRLLSPQLDKTDLLLQKIDAGMSLDNYSAEWIEIETSYIHTLNNDKLKDISEYEYIKKHVDNTIFLFHIFTDLWKSSTQDGYKFTETSYGLNCSYEKLGDHIVCRISELKSSALYAIRKEILTMRNGIQEGW